MNFLAKNKSPYLSNPQRLSDVIAAIQAMAVYSFYKLDFNSWSERITGTNSNSDYWKDVIRQHPEFFRLDSSGSKASLIWRRNSQRRYPPVSG